MSELYKRFRPRKLADVVGNEGTVRALETAIKAGNLPHTILFSGPSGCGKTTLARIAKDMLGCGDMDFKELNSASYRGIDSVRDIQRVMNLSPASGPVRVYLMDEVHKLSNDAQNAALKMLEDTPPHVYFFLATTDPGKLIAAVKTRCTEMPVKLLNEKELETLAARVCKKAGIDLNTATTEAAITACNGSARSLLVMIDKVRNITDTNQQLEAIADAQAAENVAIDLCRALIKREKWPVVAGILKGMKEEPEAVRWAVLGYAKAVLLSKGDHRAYIVLDCFKSNFFDSKEAGLVRASFEAITADS